jgi:hypothetical protein
LFVSNDASDADGVRGTDFLDVLRRLIGVAETVRCLGRICPIQALDSPFHEEITGKEALAF